MFYKYNEKRKNKVSRDSHIIQCGAGTALFVRRNMGLPQWLKSWSMHPMNRSWVLPTEAKDFNPTCGPLKLVIHLLL